MVGNELDFGKAFVYSCYFQKTFGYEQFIAEHVVSYQLEGETHVEHQKGNFILKAGQLMIARKNQLAKAFKHPSPQGEYKVLSVMLHAERLKKYAVDHHIHSSNTYAGDLNLRLEKDTFLEGYFQTLLPYVEQKTAVSKQMEDMKVTELTVLLLERNPQLLDFLFDFTEPFKIDLEEFMTKNYQYNVPLENFAKLSGRSLASFKRDFEKIFNTSPGKWLKEKRLTEAFELIASKQRKPADIYLDLGFENLSHFYASFKEKFGVTPATILSK
ncbi:helix-turn-helix domain-containing protein [Sphingobacterium sp. Mn56C]|uniref:helix-turn-helix domain-containing protein n=1 Tax=Sphingobacterium sp. Mn56C TaxID=3395261 RepID=UPI003BC786F5